MSRIRASTVIAALFAIMAMLAMPATAAQAAPTKHYPAPPPVLVVNKGVVKYGVSVRATGRQYAAKERVYVTVVYRAKGSHRWRTVKTAVVRTNSKGKFTIDVRMFRPGLVVIKAAGTKSKQKASATVFVLDKKKGGGPWSIRPMAFTPAPEPAGSPSPAIAIAGIGALALAGSALVTRQTIRRRRRA